ncbi:hypothetical protein ACFWOJ_29320 [Streptomyces sp. NPDC058439]|uniref:hypothetical protein n=1 Tax=Streptomyces sp. NPDC058439 TaxID=3346500 RepID=UPI003646CA41
MVTHPALTGLSRSNLDQLTLEMRELATFEGSITPHRRPKLTFDQQAWAAVLDQRGISGSLIAHLLHVSAPSRPWSCCSRACGPGARG